MDAYETRKIEYLGKEKGEILFKETKNFKMNLDGIRMRLRNIEINKDNIKAQSRELKRQYLMYEDEEKNLKKNA